MSARKIIVEWRSGRRKQLGLFLRLLNLTSYADCGSTHWSADEWNITDTLPSLSLYVAEKLRDSLAAAHLAQLESLEGKISLRIIPPDHTPTFFTVPQDLIVKVWLSPGGKTKHVGAWPLVNRTEASLQWPAYLFIFLQPALGLEGHMGFIEQFPPWLCVTLVGVTIPGAHFSHQQLVPWLVHTLCILHSTLLVLILTSVILGNYYYH